MIYLRRIEKYPTTHRPIKFPMDCNTDIEKTPSFTCRECGKRVTEPLPCYSYHRLSMCTTCCDKISCYDRDKKVKFIVRTKKHRLHYMKKRAIQRKIPLSALHTAPPCPLCGGTRAKKLRPSYAIILHCIICDYRRAYPMKGYFRWVRDYDILDGYGRR